MAEQGTGGTSKRGRPSVVPGEESIRVETSFEVSLWRDLRRVAQSDFDADGNVNEAIRIACREFVRNKLRPPAPRP